MKTIISIDPGFKGAISIMTTTPTLIGLYDMPVIKNVSKKLGKPSITYTYDEDAIRNILKMYNHDTTIVVIEKQYPMTKQGVVSMFKTGYGYGLVKGISIGIGINIQEASPRKWKKEMMPNMDKVDSCRLAKEVFPKAELYTKRGRAIDGRGDSVLIGLWYIEQLKNIETNEEYN